MPMHKIYVTRDASVTYVAEVDLPLDQIEARCGKREFDTDGLHEFKWELHSISTYDDVEIYEITHNEKKIIDGQPVIDEITDKQWDLS